MTRAAVISDVPSRDYYDNLNSLYGWPEVIIFAICSEVIQSLNKYKYLML